MITWDEPAGCASARGWLLTGGTCVGFYLDYGPDSHRPGHVSDVGGGRMISFCQPDRPCAECQPGDILCVRYPAGPGTANTSHYVETVEQAREWVETGDLAPVVLNFPGFPPVRGVGPVITEVRA